MANSDYDAIALKYVKHVESPTSWNNLYERPAMLSMLGTLKDKVVLDMGCATGYYSFHALEQGAAAVTAVDISRGMLDILSADMRAEQLEIIQSDVSAGLPFTRDDSVDVFISSLMLHYIEDWTFLVSDMYRSLTPGGKVFISTHHPFLDWHHFQKQSYFKTTYEEDTWGNGENAFKVQFYTRPLSEVLRPFLRSPFKINRIEELLPNEKCKRLNPNVYDFLSRQPGFLFLELEK